MTFDRRRDKSLTGCLLAGMAEEERRILLVDDDDMLCELFAKMVKREYHGALTTTNSIAGARWLLAHNVFDCAILDFRLLNGESIQLYRDMRETTPCTKVVFLTGYSSDELVRKVAAIGTARVLPKDRLSDLDFSRELLDDLGLVRR